ncbi:MAG: GNAT family N-acetyltransferase, partial [Bacillota bacterium]
MKKVINPNYSKCSNILYRGSPSFSGIAAGECEGDVWVDDLENPSLALVYSYAVGGFSIMGSPSDVSVYDDFIEFLRRELFTHLKSKGINYFEFSMESKRAEAYILQRFADEKINQENEYFYRRYNAYEIQDIDNYNIVPVDPVFIKNLQAGRYDNPNFLRERLLKSWGSYENFFGKSTAYAATLDTSIIAVIVGTARYQDVIPIDIETKEEY